MLSIMLPKNTERIPATTLVTTEPAIANVLTNSAFWFLLQPLKRFVQ